MIKFVYGKIFEEIRKSDFMQKIEVMYFRGFPEKIHPNKTSNLSSSNGK